MTEPGSIRPGERTAHIRAAVFDATLAKLVSEGYARTSVEVIATRSGVHKTTVYRRWGTKDRLMAEALQEAAEGRIAIRTPVTSTTTCVPWLAPSRLR